MSAFAQSEDEMEALLKQSKLELYANPNETLQKARLTLRNAKTPVLAAKDYNIIALADHVKGNNEFALMEVFAAKTILQEHEDDRLLAESEMVLGGIASNLGLYQWATGRFRNVAELCAKNNENLSA